MSSRITATFELVTPLFLGGADPARTVELRSPSIKGALRFWWRALAWSRGSDLGAIRGNERQVFGSAGSEADGAGQSSFGLRVQWLHRADRLASDHVRSLVSGRLGATYLGYGVINRGQGNPPRPCRPAGRFAVKLYSLRRRQLEAPLEQSLLDAVKLFGLIGGLGGRARRGWGSVALTGIDGDKAWESPNTLAAYRDRLTSLLGHTVDARPPVYSAFGGGVRLQILGLSNDPMLALERLGQVYKQYRSENRSYIFGLPHSRFKGTAGRRASPLLFHIHPIDGRYAVAAIFFRAPFLEAQPPWPDYRVVDRFLDGLPATMRAGGFAQAFEVL